MIRASNKLRSTNGVVCVTVRPKPGNQSRCLVRFSNQTIEGSLGRTGRTAYKREGDGATPIANMRVIEGYFRPDRKAALRAQIKMSPTRSNLGWCDDVNSPNYNRAVKLPFDASHETMLRADILYDYFIILDWNITCRKKHHGSAIFFHVAKEGYPPTQGCIAISKRDMARLIPCLSTKTRVIVL